jgi:hypothetical protein
MQEAINEGAVQATDITSFSKLSGAARAMADVTVGSCVYNYARLATDWTRYCSCSPQAWAEWPFDSFYEDELSKTRICEGGDRHGKLCTDEVCVCIYVYVCMHVCM